jgi:hypothetical protein
MKTKLTTTMIKMVLIITLISLIFSCKKDVTHNGYSMPAINNALNDASSKPTVYLNVTLNGPEKNSKMSGTIKFRQEPDTAKIITLDTKVYYLMPNHAYVLQRAVNPIADPTGCSSTTWLTLGYGPTPHSIHTDASGNGEAKLWRNVTAIPSGTAFHIHFQVVDSASLTPVLTSDCYNYAVK